MQHKADQRVSDFIRHLERVFRVAYGRDGMLPETRDALLFSQLQEGLSHNLMEAPAVSGAANYSALCIAAKNEERRQAALHSRQAYCQPKLSVSSMSEDKSMRKQTAPKARPQGSETDTRKCYVCGKLGHIARNCHNKKRSESSGQKISKPGCNNQTRTCQVRAEEKHGVRQHSSRDDPDDYLYSSEGSSDDVQVKQIVVQDGAVNHTVPSSRYRESLQRG